MCERAVLTMLRKGQNLMEKVATKKSQTVRNQMEKQSWQKMELSYLGDAAELIQGGGGKLTPVGGDPGEHRKQQPVG